MAKKIKLGKKPLGEPPLSPVTVSQLQDYVEWFSALPMESKALVSSRSDNKDFIKWLKTVSTLL